MNFLIQALQYVLHLDVHLVELVNLYGAWVYAILFVLIFAETGLVVTPFIPGDSLLFIAGAIAATGGMNVFLLFLALFAAAVVGNTTNYWIGRWLGPRVFHWEQSRWFNKRALDETHQFYERYGPITVTLARFMPFVRTFAPFVAGVGAMPHGRFQFWSVLGGFLWIGGFLLLGYFFGNIPFVQHNLAVLMVVIVLLSLSPIIWGWAKARMRR